MKRSENILLLGLGGVGRYLARRLSFDGHSVTVIETDLDLIQAAESELDARLVRGDALDFNCWEAVRARDMDYLIAVTDDDAVNILAARIADTYGIPQKIARVRSMRIWEEDAPISAADLKIDLVIRPAELAAQEIARLLMMRSGNVVLDIGDGSLQVVATHISSGGLLANKRVQDIAEDKSLQLRVVCVARGIETLIPNGAFVIRPDDHVYLMTTRADIPRIMRLAGIKDSVRQRLLIVGGGNIGIRTAELLEEKYPVRLLERDEMRAEELSYKLKRTQCLNGDGSNGETLLNAGLLRMDTIITATGDNETNIMSAVLAKHIIATRSAGGQASKSIVCVNREEYVTLATAMGADIAVSAKVLAGNRILRYIRRGHVLSVAHLHGCDAEVVELLADSGSPITKAKLADLGLLQGQLMIGAVFRDDRWWVATGETRIAPGERVVCICTSPHLRDLQRLFLK